MSCEENPPPSTPPIESTSSSPPSFSPTTSSSSPPPAISSLPPASPSPATPHFIGKREDIIQARRVTKLVNGCRDILVLYHQGEIHAMDMRCYHAGGPLQNGDIEPRTVVLKVGHRDPLEVCDTCTHMREFNGRSCIVCPWHKYKITLAEGEALYQAVDHPTRTPLRTYWRSKGVKQRVHKVTEVNGSVYVTLNDAGDAIESDAYQTERYRAMWSKGRPKTSPGFHKPNQKLCTNKNLF